MSSATSYLGLEKDRFMSSTDRDVSIYLDNLATRLKHSGDSGRSANSEKHWQLIERVLAYAASAEQHISEQQMRIAELESLTTTDELTELPNRRGLREFLRRTLAAAKRHTESGVLAFIDLNDFKHVNDTYGHNAGDEMLQHMAKLLRKSLRNSDYVARVGGDEFVIVLVRASKDLGVKRARSIQTALSRSFIEKRGEKIYLSASFGIADYDGNSSIQQLLRKSDLRMYEDKKQHRLIAGTSKLG